MTLDKDKSPYELMQEGCPKTLGKSAKGWAERVSSDTNRLVDRYLNTNHAGDAYASFGELKRFIEDSKATLEAFEKAIIPFDENERLLYDILDHKWQCSDIGISDKERIKLDEFRAKLGYDSTYEAEAEKNGD